MKELKKGKFIVFEGIDGSGKTTQIKLLSEYLTKQNIKNTVGKEPTDNPIGKLLREYLSGKKQTDPYAIGALFASDRLDHITTKGGILDTVNGGEYYLCDRYYLSNCAYQGTECDLNWLASQNSKAKEIAKPDLVIFIDVDPQTSMNRVSSRGLDKEIYENTQKQQAIRDNYFKLFETVAKDENIVIIDGNRDIESISKDVIKAVEKSL